MTLALSFNDTQQYKNKDKKKNLTNFNGIIVELFFSRSAEM